MFNTLTHSNQLPVLPFRSFFLRKQVLSDDTFNISVQFTFGFLFWRFLLQFEFAEVQLVLLLNLAHVLQHPGLDVFILLSLGGPFLAVVVALNGRFGERH